MTKRKALGKGLSALIPDADRLDESEPLFFQCPIDTISPNPHQPRQEFSPVELDEMAANAAGMPFVAYKNSSLTADYYIQNLMEIAEILGV